MLALRSAQFMNNRRNMVIDGRCVSDKTPNTNTKAHPSVACSGGTTSIQPSKKKKKGIRSPDFTSCIKNESGNHYICMYIYT